jgi:lysophospholipase L1-like esterase
VSTIKICSRLFLLALAILFAPRARSEFAIRDGDTVVFLGDSITAARVYGEIIEDYTLLRFPQWKVKFINAGKGGETAQQSLARLDQDIFARGATLLTVAYGVNDIGWGMRADAAHKKAYLDAIGEIVRRCAQHQVRVFICSAAITAEAPDRAAQGFLQAMGDEGLALAKAQGAGAIDLQRAMRDIQRRALAANKTKTDKEKQLLLHVGDGIHLNDLGQMAMAFAILKGLGAPADVSAVTIQAGPTPASTGEQCQVTDVQCAADQVTFTRADDGLPFNFGPLWVLDEAFIPFGDELNRYLLTVTGLHEGQWEISAGGRPLGQWSAAALAHGINLASATTNGWEPGGPWDAQAGALKTFTEMRNNLVSARRDLEQTLTSNTNFPALREQTIALEKQIVELQHAITQPAPVQFILRKITAPPPGGPSP